MPGYNQLQRKLRERILGMHYKANAGHIGCSLSCIDIIITVLKFLKKHEDSFILSKGHAASALYTALNELGEISDEILETFYKNGTTLPAHPAPSKYNSISFAIGSLGHGFPLSTGIALAQKIKANNNFSYVLMSDGETNEGTTWEAAHFAVINKLDNLIVIIDKNGLQGFDETKYVLGDTASCKTWEEIGFEVVEISGHNIEQLINTITELQKNKNGVPKLVIANTIKGKGVSFMENKLEWHYLPMNEEQYNLALSELEEHYQF